VSGAIYSSYSRPLQNGLEEFLSENEGVKNSLQSLRSTSTCPVTRLIGRFKLAYSAKRAGRAEIWQVDLVHGAESVLSADDEYVRDEPQWSPDGRQLECETVCDTNKISTDRA
jgi:hypothetical protein